MGFHMLIMKYCEIKCPNQSCNDIIRVYHKDEKNKPGSGKRGSRGYVRSSIGFKSSMKATRGSNIMKFLVTH